MKLNTYQKKKNPAVNNKKNCHIENLVANRLTLYIKHNVNIIQIIKYPIFSVHSSVPKLPLYASCTVNRYECNPNFYFSKTWCDESIVIMICVCVSARQSEYDNAILYFGHSMVIQVSFRTIYCNYFSDIPPKIFKCDVDMIC